MKKTIAFLLIALLTLSFSAALADSAPKSKEDQMVGLVKGFLEENEFPYEYDDYTFTVPFAVENSMEYVYMTVYIYDDMLAVSADAPVQGTGDVFEKMAVFAALANNELKPGATSFKAGKLGEFAIAKDQILLGKPFLFNKSNIDEFDF